MSAAAAGSGAPEGPTPAVSVVIPTWRRADSIRRAVDSVLRQTWRDLEVIVVDDASGDGTLEVLAQVADPRLWVLSHAANAGACAARNTGVRAARADWIAFQDSDDEWLPEKLDRQMARLADAAPDGRPWAGVYCAMLSVDRPPEGGHPRVFHLPRPAHRLEGDLSAELLEGNLISTQTLVARRAALIEAGLFDESLPKMQDWDLALRLAPLGPIAYVETPLVVQTFSENSLTRARDKRFAGYAGVLAKHAAAFAAHPAVLARHCQAMALGRAELGDRRGALAWTRRALATAPGRIAPRGWLRLGRALLTGVRAA